MVAMSSIFLKVLYKPAIQVLTRAIEAREPGISFHIPW